MQNKKLILENFIRNLNIIIQNESRELIFVCIGNSSVIGDSFGPLVGSYLKIMTNKKKEIKILGDIENPIYTEKKIKEIEKLDSKKNCLIVIDAAFSKENIANKIFVSKNKTSLGNGVGETIGILGDVSIKGVVAQYSKNYENNLNKLENINTKEVIDMAKLVSYGIIKTINNKI